MPIFVENRPQASGKMGFVYDISGDNVVSVATDIITMADAPFVFQGKVGEKKHLLQQPEFVATPLQQGGLVAGSVPFSGMSVNVYFMSLSELLVVPADGDRMTADALVSAEDTSYMLPDGTFSDDDDYDPFDGARMGETAEFGTMGGGMTDPRGRSAELVDRYGIDEEDEFSNPYPPAASSSGSQGEIMTKKDWFVTLLLLAIPVVNVIVLIMWLVSKKTNPSKKNYLVIQLVFWVISLLLSLGLAAAIVSAGLANGVFPIGSTDAQDDAENSYYESGYNPDVDGNDVAGSIAAGMDAPDDEDENENSGSDVPVNSNTANGMNVAGGSVGAQGQTSAAGTVTVDAIARQIDGEARPVAVITMTAMNTGADALAPSAMYDITGMQGQNSLAPNFAPLDGFAPETFDMPIAPGTSGTFQVCYVLADDQDITVNVSAKGTGEQLARVTQAV